MHTSVMPLPGAGRRRGRYSDEFKRKVMVACKQPGVSTAAVALANGLSTANNNDHHLWSRWARWALTAVFALPPEHRVRMRTTKGLERLNKEIKRRTRVPTLFPNTASCLRLVTSILAEQDHEWTTAKTYLNIKP